jgi:hypothetical protein
LAVCRVALALGKYPHQIMTEPSDFEVEMLDAYLTLVEETAQNA